MRQNAHNRLVGFADAFIGLPFVWGKTDCVSITLQAMDAIFDTDVHEKIVDWHDEKSALKTLRTVKPEWYLPQLGAKKIDIIQLTACDVLTGYLDDVALPTTQVVVGRMLMSSTPERGVFAYRMDYDELAALDLTAWRLP